MRFEVIAVALLAAACDIPTDLPKWNPSFAIPLEATSIPLAQLLPGGVTVSADRTTFLISAGSYTAEYRLTNVCPPCRPLEGQVVPKPAFVGGIGYSIPLPSGVDSANVVGGSLNFRMTNGWSFDPLRPAAGQIGAITVDVIARDFVSRGFAAFVGNNRSFAPGSTINGSVTFAGAPLREPIVHVRFNSPAGDPVRIDGQSSLTFTLLSGQLVATDVTVNIAQRQLTGIPLQLDLTGIDDFIIRRVQGGKLVLTLDNQFAVRGTMTLSLTGGLAPVVKTFTLQANDTTSEVTLTEAELEAVLGQSVVASLSGFVSTSGSVVLTPSSTFTIEPLLVLELGSDGQ